MVKVAVFGYGTVGSGAVEVMVKNREEIKKRNGVDLEVKYILDLRDFPGDPMEDKVVHDVETILNDPEVAVICETMGGVNPAYTFTKRALEAGKSVCTSNKELVAAKGPELLEIAKANNATYLFEASVGGGIPIIRPILTCLTAEKIEKIQGILNGTTNYILTKMSDEGADYAEVLKQAQELGYAEKDPTADVEGHDACRKIAILSSLAMGKTVNYEDIHTEGISKITTADFAFAKKCGLQIKLIGMSKMTEEGNFAIVSPRLVDAKSPLACVQDVFNGILVTGNMLGDSMYYGRGAGKLPTASAVVGDVIEEAKNVGKNIPIQWTAEAASLKDYKELSQRYLVRVKGTDEAALSKAFPGCEMIRVEEVADEVAVLTEEMKESAYDQAVQGLSVVSMIRM